MVVPPAGLEPARLAAVDFESTVSAIPPEGHWCARWDSNPQDPGSEPGKATDYITRAKCIGVTLSQATSFGALMKGSLAEYP